VAIRRHILTSTLIDARYSGRITNRRCRRVVMPGLDPGIHLPSQEVFRRWMDCRVKPGNDALQLCLKPLDQAGVDQQPVEAPSLRAAGAGVKQALAALENS